MSQIEEGGPPSIFMSMTLTFLQGLHDLKIETSGKGRLFAFKICEPIKDKTGFSPPIGNVDRPLGSETAALKGRTGRVGWVCMLAQFLLDFVVNTRIPTLSYICPKNNHHE